MTVTPVTGGFDVSWTAVPDAQGYRYRITAGAGAPSEWVRLDLATEVALADLGPAVEYVIEVSARKDNRWRPSTSVTATPLT